jgi:tetratricopeptide (TPR) repeat protein
MVCMVLLFSLPVLQLAFAGGLEGAGLTQMAAPPSRTPTVQSLGASEQPNLGRLHHPISTSSAQAQKLFDQGFALVFAFNHDEAVRSFSRAAECDPQAAMPQWGIALALGPNINLPDLDLAREKAAYRAVHKALSLASGATEKERGYIAALARRYSIDPQADHKSLAVQYANAMGELSRQYRDDLDLATLYAESLMDLNPDKLWSPAGKPVEGTQRIVDVLESVLRRDPEHLGANHYYIHAVEASAHPERALASARRLETLAPDAGHLLHMPSHIYVRLGDYAAAARSNVAAIRVDRAYLERTASQGSDYDLMYYSHDLHFLAYSYAEAGRYGDAKRAADELVTHVRPYIQKMPMAEYYLPAPLFVLMRFGRWKEILGGSAPDLTAPITAWLWHFGRGLAYSATGEIADAEQELIIVESAAKKVPADSHLGGYFNPTRSLLELASAVLAARIAGAYGKRKRAIELWRKAVELQDNLDYSAPPEWYYPVCESLGAALYLDRRPADAEGIFRADLKIHPGNGRSLFGLWQSLKTQGKKAEAARIKTEFKAAWKDADVALRIEDL